jgi:hypothetical protein
LTNVVGTGIFLNTHLLGQAAIVVEFSRDDNNATRRHIYNGKSPPENIMDSCSPNSEQHVKKSTTTSNSWCLAWASNLSQRRYLLHRPHYRNHRLQKQWHQQNEATSCKPHSKAHRSFSRTRVNLQTPHRADLPLSLYESQLHRSRFLSRRAVATVKSLGGRSSHPHRVDRRDLDRMIFHYVNVRDDHTRHLIGYQGQLRRQPHSLS